MGMQSLRDKLLQAGVVTKEQADANEKKAEAERAAEKARARNHARPAPKPQPAPRVESEKGRERRLNRELADRQKMIRALCDAKELADRGDQPFFYRTRRRELRRLYLTPDQHAGLEKGELAIVDRPNGNERPHALVPRAIAEQVLALEQKAIRFWAKSDTERFGFEDEPSTDAEQAQAAEAGAADSENTVEPEAPADTPAS